MLRLLEQKLSDVLNFFGHYATIKLRPLRPGRYPFTGEFHPDTANGVVVAE
jgi:hypothetical protein